MFNPQLISFKEYLLTWEVLDALFRVLFYILSTEILVPLNKKIVITEMFHTRHKAFDSTRGTIYDHKTFYRIIIVSYIKTGKGLQMKAFCSRSDKIRTKIFLEGLKLTIAVNPSQQWSWWAELYMTNVFLSWRLYGNWAHEISCVSCRCTSPVKKNCDKWYFYRQQAYDVIGTA